MAEIRIENLNKSFGGVQVLHDVSLTISEREFCVFVGPSGCGKSTLLRLIAGLEDVSSGRIFIGGKDVTNLEPYDRQLAMVFQSYALYPHMNVRENIAFALRTAKIPEVQITKKIAEATRILQLDDYLDRKPSALSGGQRQRVAIGRAIVREPIAFLFDEPLSNLDAALRAETRVEIAALHRSLNATTIYVTHDQTEAMTLADRIVVLKDGKIMQTGSPPELYDNPENVFVAQFLGSPKMNILDAELTGTGIRVLGQNEVVFSHGFSPLPIQLGIRPEVISLVSPDKGLFSGQVTLNEFHGGSRTVIAAIGAGTSVTLQLPTGQSPAVGEHIGLHCDPDNFHIFHANGERLQPIGRNH
ncbi:MAG: ABC transporter ATP-binding protein [Gammaproteobacteria bacterium TMED222]|nr:MAG: ABC transporter ATP-binding protein [Gammaproteobacteria bacterium TMED222]|tara:strand:- start:278 stop:1351 length:1074 start_codon:yes stop_codon:yes gene_type:complete